MLYQGIELSKRESEVVLFLQTGSHNFWDAYYNYFVRKERKDYPTLIIANWFNSVLKELQNKKLYFSWVLKTRIHNSGPYKYIWKNNIT